MNSVKFSIVIPVYNVEKYLAASLDALIGQTYKNLEIVAVNDGSTDKSLEILQKYADKDSRLIVINSENKGVSAARNLALSQVTGDYVWMVDSDDLINPDALKVLEGIINNTKADIVTFRYQKLYKNKEPSLEVPLAPQYHELNRIDFFQTMSDKANVSGKYAGGYVWLRVFKNSLLQDLRFNEKMRFYEDEDFLLRLYTAFSDKSLRIVSIGEKLYLYRKRLSSLMNSNRSERLFNLYAFQRRTMLLFAKNSPEYQIIDHSRLVSLIRLTQLALCSGRYGAFDKFKRILLSRRKELSFRQILPYLFGRDIARKYSVKRTSNTKQLKQKDSFWE